MYQISHGNVTSVPVVLIFLVRLLISLIVGIY